MHFEFLDPEKNKKAEEIGKKYGITDWRDVDAYIEIWNKNKVQIDGDLTFQELLALCEVMQFLNNIRG